ncbi:MAG TPA: aldo/keto reductase, partial [Pirellulaceae bacterium]
MASLPTRPIPSTGQPLPILGLGTWQTFDVGPTRAERAPLEEVLRTFAGLGGSLLDSSPMYDRSEEVAGEIAARLDLRPRLFMATKVWTRGKEAGRKQMEDSLRKLKADPIDLMQVHNLVDTGAHLGTLADWKKAGRVRYLGITHYHASAHDEAARTLTAHPVDFLQINYSAAEREAERKLL